MKIPKYVENILSRSKYFYGKVDDEYLDVGYALKVNKPTPYTRIDTFRDELNRLGAWVERNGSEFNLVSVPDSTHYYDQYAVVVIYDPLMLRIEHLIGGTK